MEKLLNTREAAPLCGVEPHTLENWRLLGKGPAFIRAGRNVLYEPSDIRQWRDSNRYSSTAQAA